MVEQGASTLWERWDGWTPEKGFQDPGILEIESGDRLEVREVMAEGLETIKLKGVVPPIRFESGVADIPDSSIDALREKLADGYEPGADLNAVVRLALDAIEAVEDREIPAGDWEAAVLDRDLGRRKFRRLDAAEIEAARE